jgi:hypothetical protein
MAVVCGMLPSSTLIPSKPIPPQAKHSRHGEPGAAVPRPSRFRASAARAIEAARRPASVLKTDQRRALWFSTAAFTVCFAVWTIFAIIGIQM